jgi:hypothetical protein
MMHPAALLQQGQVTTQVYNRLCISREKVDLSTHDAESLDKHISLLCLFQLHTSEASDIWI